MAARQICAVPRELEGTDQPTLSQRVARLYRHLRAGECLTARQITALLGYRDVSSTHRLMLTLEREDPNLVRDATFDLTSDRPIMVWYLQESCKFRK